MATFSSFIRKTSPNMRKALAEHLGLSMPDNVDWAEPSLKFAPAMALAIDKCTETEKANAATKLERVMSLADEFGDRAMKSCWPDHAEPLELTGVADRATWLLINHPESFQHAEEACFIDGLRRSRRFDGHVLSEGLAVLQSVDSKAAFKEALKGVVSDGKIQVDIFERTRRDFAGNEYRVVQVTVYAEQKTETNLEFDGDTLSSVPRRPVLSAALTYEPKTGTVEVAADSRKVRDGIVSAFIKNLLDQETSISALKLRRYDLQHLKLPRDFSTDAKDGIEQVKLVSLRLMPFGQDDQRLTLEVNRGSKRSIWDAAEMHFRDRSPMHAGWLVTSAKLSVTFRPTGTAKRGKTITLQITEPNGCDLKERTEREQMIGNKYLRRWEILIDEPDLLEG
jgi:hypothetical protein